MLGRVVAVDAGVPHGTRGLNRVGARYFYWRAYSRPAVSERDAAPSVVRSSVAIVLTFDVRSVHILLSDIAANSLAGCKRLSPGAAAGVLANGWHWPA